MRYPIYLHYDHTQHVGFVDINEDVPNDVFQEGAVLPKLSRAGDEGPFTLISFGLVPRTEVDTRPRKLE